MPEATLAGEKAADRKPNSNKDIFENCIKVSFFLSDARAY